MKVVGTGCGPGMITLEAIEAIGQARRIYGSARAIALVREHIHEACEVREINDYKKLAELPEDSVLLSTGDPMLAGLGGYGSVIIPGISSMQVAFARLRLPLSEAVVVTAHGRDHDEAVSMTAEEVARNRIVFLIADPWFDVKKLAGHLACCGLACEIVLCEELGYPAERIAKGTVAAPPGAKSGMFSLVIGNFGREEKR
jgi:cobalt-precorrin-7 (C5)-methyltransferase